MSTRRRVVVCLSVLAILVLGMGVVTASMSAGLPHERAANWVTANRSTLPDTLPALAAYPAAWRTAIVRALAPAVKSRLWREQLALILDQHPEFSSTQRDAVRTLMRIATPASFEPGGEPKGVCQSLRGVLGSRPRGALTQG